MKCIMRTVGWIGMIALYATVLLIIIVQWTPNSWTPFHELFPSILLFEYATWGAIILSILSLLILLKYRANETKCTWAIRIRYLIFAVILAVVGGFLGYAGVIKGGEAVGNFILKDSLSEVSVQALIKEKRSSDHCEAELVLDKGEENSLTTNFKNIFVPSHICVANEIYNEVEEGGPVVMLGKAHDHIGFFIESIITPSELEKIQETIQNTDQENAEEDSSDKEDNSDTPENNEDNT